MCQDTPRHYAENVQSAEKETKMRWIILILILYLPVILYGNLWMHEQAHAQINEYTGCPDSQVHVGVFQGWTKCLNSSMRTQSQTEEAYRLHALNEIYGYNTDLIAHSIIWSGLLISVLIWGKKQNGREY